VYVLGDMFRFFEISGVDGMKRKRDYVFHYIKKGKHTIDMLLIHQTRNREDCK
jgi:hypothetical protein